MTWVTSLPKPVKAPELRRLCGEVSLGLRNDFCVKVWRGDQPNGEIECFVEVFHDDGMRGMRLCGKHGTDVLEVWRIAEEVFGPASTLNFMPSTKTTLPGVPEFGELLAWWPA